MNRKEKLAREIKILRAENGLTQKELSEASGVALITIGLLEAKCSKKLPRVETLVKLAKALNVDSEKLTRYLP